MRLLSNNKGLTLLEVVVAIGLVVTGLVGTLMMLAQVTKDFRGADNRLIAAQLGQEAIEVVVNIRDTNWIEGEAYNTGIPETTSGTVNYNSTAVQEDGSQCLSREDDFYVHGTAPCNTLFERRLEITNQGNYLEVVAVVSWTEAGGRTPSVTMVDHLYDWR